MGPVKTAGIGAPGVNMVFSILSFFFRQMMMVMIINDDDQEEEQKEEDIKIGDPKTMVNLDDLEGYPNFRKPPYTYIIYVRR